MSYTVFKALHIIFMVSWFAGLFYIVRLFIYHTEAQEKDEVEKNILSKQFVEMEKKLWWIITTPAMILTVIFGVSMLIYNPALLKMDWMHLKLAFVLLLLIYHFTCQKIMFKLKNNEFTWTSNKLRLWNEVATLALVAIVFLVIMKNSLNWIYGTIGFFAVAIALMIGIKIYKRIRNK
ncbi:protoporphyrinogen oxidase HemJ [Brumimicrobium aurantiacum]|uniref:Protoporphyrinogen IX oxidase n=1 Tax=Brumimicrobium aurantiacum TaxID=1737063 RepID=A0A3E1F1G9_9FLAO|nr:protoporphyrinogen oxidase HemJ [Brumimicrobium aurantiacum]RFC55589.1 protoporphyrinogen oxidase HemJ [Brumimicrobium aurantiacum]